MAALPAGCEGSLHGARVNHGEHAPAFQHDQELGDASLCSALRTLASYLLAGEEKSICS